MKIIIAFLFIGWYIGMKQNDNYKVFWTEVKNLFTHKETTEDLMFGLLAIFLLFGIPVLLFLWLVAI